MTLFHQLQKLEISGLIRLVQEYPELEYLFRHALVQDAAYESLLLSDRKQMHSTVAQVLEQLFGEQLDEVAVVLGHHWQLAGRPQKALHYFVQAGDVAAKAYANDEAVAHYGRSLTLAQQTAADSDTLVHVCTALGRVLEIQSNYHKALTHYQDMSQLAEQINDQALALAALMGRTNLRVTATPVHDLILGESLAQQAMAFAQKLGDQPAQIRLLWNMLNFYQYSGRPEQAITTGEQALILARQQQVIEIEAYILNDLALCYNAYGRLQDSLHTSEQARALWRQLNNLPMLIDSLALSGISSYYRGDYAQSIALGDEGFKLGQAIDNPQAQAYVRIQTGLAHWKLGQITPAIIVSSASRQLAEEVHFIPVQIYAHANLALILNNLGALDAALTEAQIAQTLAENHFQVALMYARAVLTLVQMKQENLALAGATIKQIKVDASYNTRPGYDALIYLVEVMWLVKNGRYPQALTAIQANQESIHGREFIGLHPDYLLLKAQSLSAMNQYEAAQAALQEARTLAEAHHNRHLLWQILAEEATLLETVDEYETAQLLRHQARQILTEIMADVPNEYLDSFKGMAAVTAVLQTS
jgi:tetratricopeptide (TPR) repeat protein